MIPNEAAMVDRIVTVNAIRITYQTELASKFPFATERDWPTRHKHGQMTHCDRAGNSQRRREQHYHQNTDVAHSGFGKSPWNDMESEGGKRGVTLGLAHKHGRMT